MTAASARKTARESRVGKPEMVEAALAIVAREGLEALSFRRLAADLDISPMSVHRIARDKEQLLDLLTEAMFSKVEYRVECRGWNDCLAAIARSARSVLERYPELAYRAASRPNMYSSVTGARVVNRAVECLLEAGFSPKGAALAFAMSRYVQVIALTAAPARLDDEAAMVPVYLPGADSALTSVAPYCADMDGHEAFEFALEVMLLGFERYAALRNEEKPATKSA